MINGQIGQLKTIVLVWGISIIGVSSVYAQYEMLDVTTSIGVDHGWGQFGLFGGGVSFYDFDKDGWDDLTFATSGDSIHFYKNNLGLFERIDLGIGLTGEIKQVLWVDQDNDGDLDLFVTQRNGENHLYENIGALTFIDITQTSGILYQSAPTFGAGWGDINSDGLLDLYITNRLEFPNFCNYLYLNNGDDTFTNITWTAGVADSLKLPFLPVLLDFDKDGDQDIYLIQDKGYGNTMYSNNGDNTFSDVSQSVGAYLEMDAMSGTVEDMDGNGYPDIYITNTPTSITNPMNKLLMNYNGMFAEEAASRGLEYGYIGWGANWFDMDNDADLDLHVCGETTLLPDTQQSFLINDGSGYFSPAIMTMNYDSAKSHGAAIGDINNDGAIDVVINNSHPSRSLVLQNNSVTGHWLKVDLLGTISNIEGVGCQIDLWTNGHYQARYKLCGESYISQNSGTEHFGLGSSLIIDSLRVIWPSGMIDTEYSISVDQRITMIEGTGLLTTTVDESSKRKDLRVFPNPVADQLNIYLTTDVIKTVDVLDPSGKRIDLDLTISNGRATCDTQDLDSGVYFVTITTTQGKKAITKFVKAAAH